MNALTFSIPNVRKDCARNLAILYREILFNYRLGRCFSGNEHFAKFLGCSPDSVRRLLAILVKHGFCTVTVEFGKFRTITPLVPYEAMVAAWDMFAYICRTTKKLGKSAMDFASESLGISPKMPLNCSGEADNCSAHIKRNSKRERTTTTEKAVEADVVVVSSLCEIVDTANAQTLAVLAKREGASLEEVRAVIAAYRQQGDKVKNFMAWATTAIRKRYKPTSKQETTTITTNTAVCKEESYHEMRCRKMPILPWKKRQFSI